MSLRGSSYNITNHQLCGYLVFPPELKPPSSSTTENSLMSDWIEIHHTSDDDQDTKRNSETLSIRSTPTKSFNLKHGSSSLLSLSNPDVTIRSDGKIKKPTIEYRKGSRGAIFDVSSASIAIVHACNAEGYWGKGFALDVKEMYPKAYNTYREFCMSSAQPVRNVGRSMLIEPYSLIPKRRLFLYPFIGCLFTNKGIGGRYLSAQDMRESILKATKKSLESLLNGIDEAVRGRIIEPISEIRMPRINSGLFQVPWKETERILLGLTLPPGFDMSFKIVVYSIDHNQAKS